jgi:thiamine biosynthesis lipoprotein
LAGDILSTAVFILGTEKGLALLETLPEIEGLLITEDMQIVSTPGFFS